MYRAWYTMRAPSTMASFFLCILQQASGQVFCPPHLYSCLLHSDNWDVTNIHTDWGLFRVPRVFQALRRKCGVTGLKGRPRLFEGLGTPSLKSGIFSFVIYIRLSTVYVIDSLCHYSQSNHSPWAHCVFVCCVLRMSKPVTSLMSSSKCYLLSKIAPDQYSELFLIPFSFECIVV